MDNLETTVKVVAAVLQTLSIAVTAYYVLTITRKRGICDRLAVRRLPWGRD